MSNLKCVSRKGAYGLERAENSNIPTSYHNLLSYKKRHAQTPEGEQTARAEYDADLATLILSREERPHVIVCAGWMHIFTSSFITPINTRGIQIINLHPALPNDIVGANAIQRAWEEGRQGKRKATGVMVHELIVDLDAGSPIVVQEVEIREGESLGGLEERIHKVEHKLIVEGTRKVIESVPRLGEGDKEV